MSQQSLGLIETVGLVAAVEAADAALKAANVELVGYESAKGGGMMTVKLVGEVGAVKAAIAAAEVSAGRISRVVATDVIARPGFGLEGLVGSAETIGKPVEAKPEPVEPKVAPAVEPEAKAEPEKASAKPAPAPATKATASKPAARPAPAKKPEDNKKTPVRQDRKPEPTS